MRTLREWLSRLLGTLRPGRRDDDLQDELRAHLELEVEAAERRGESLETARRHALIRSAGTTQAVEHLRDQRSLPWLTDLSRDVRYACRVLAKNRGFTAAAVLSLGLGIGANTAIFSLIDAVLLRPLPVAAPHELYFLAHGEGDAPPVDSNYPLLEQYRSASVFSGVTAYQTTTFKVTTDEAIELVSGQFVSGNYYAVVGAPMLVGRGFSTESDRPGGEDDLAVISEAYWTRRFGRSPDVVGQALTIDEQRVTIVGVTAGPFAGLAPGARVDITVPLSMRIRRAPGFLTALDGFTAMPIVARLQRGVPETQALSEADALFQQFMAVPDVEWARTLMPDAYSRARLLPAGQGEHGLQRRYRQPLLALMGLAALVLLIASANVANLLLARSSARAKEVALRLCIGSGRWRLVRQLLTESLMLAVAGGVVGLLIASWSTSAIVSLLSTWRESLVLDVTPNARVFAFTTFVAAITGAVFGIVPALKTTRVDLSPVLKGGAPDHTGGSTRGALLSRGLIVAQVALCVVVVVTAALLGQSVHTLKTKPSGVDPAGVLLVHLDASSTRLAGTRIDALQADVIERLRALPGVTSAAASTMTPLDTWGNFRGLHLPGLPETPEARGVFFNEVSDDYFSTFGIRVLRGRAIGPEDVQGSRPVAVINERTARHVFGDADPIGRTIAWIPTPDVPIEVVGLVEDTSQNSLREDAPRMVYTPLAQQPGHRSLQLAMKTAANPIAAVTAARDVVRRVNPVLLVTHPRTMAEQVDSTLVRERSVSWISIAFAALASVLACVGLYGVMSYQVARRTREIGIRLALGERPGAIFGRTIRGALGLTVAGIVLGIAGSLLATRAVSALLYGLSPRDPLTLAAVSIALVVTAMAAAYFPARRAARIDPLRAIRTE